jgi:hypothetical protein
MSLEKVTEVVSPVLSSLSSLSSPVISSIPHDNTTVHITQIQVDVHHISINNEEQDNEEQDNEEQDNEEQDNEEQDYKCTERQEQVIDQLYETAKLATKEIFSISSMDQSMKIGRMMATIVKLVEKASYRGEKIPGAEKREIALILGKRLVSDPAVIGNDTVRKSVCTAYDLLGEQLMETLLDVSRHVNAAIQKAAISCCESILACMKK